MIGCLLKAAEALVVGVLVLMIVIGTLYALWHVDD